MTDPRSRGFTLIELLVVMLIIGITVSLATLAFRDNRAEELQREAERLAALIEMASEEALVRSMPIGIRFEQHGYAFYRPGAGAWAEIEDDRILRRRELHEPVELQLLVEGFSAQSSLAADEATQPQPQVFLLPSGEALPFEVTLVHPDLDRYYRIVVELTGKLILYAED